jgi:hypothetical protein
MAAAAREDRMAAGGGNGPGGNGPGVSRALLVVENHFP